MEAEVGRLIIRLKLGLRRNRQPGRPASYVCGCESAGKSEVATFANRRNAAIISSSTLAHRD